MTSISVWKEGGVRTVELLGHAGYAPQGADIVCAGLSALSCAMMEALRREEDSGALETLSIVCEPGYVSVSVRPKPAKRARIGGILDTCLAGFSLLAKGYPAHVTYRRARHNAAAEGL